MKSYTFFTSRVCSLVGQEHFLFQMFFVDIYLCYFLKILWRKYKSSVIKKRNLWQFISIFVLVQNFLFRIKCKYIDFLNFLLCFRNGRQKALQEDTTEPQRSPLLSSPRSLRSSKHSFGTQSFIYLSLRNYSKFTLIIEYCVSLR